MRRLVLKMSTSVDGFVGAPNGELKWIFRAFDDALIAWQVERVWEAGLHIMGSRTFRDMKAWWPQSSEALAAPMNAIPKAYFSRGGTDDVSATKALQEVKPMNPDHVRGPADASTESWEQATMLTGELSMQIRKLKAQDGKPVIAYGGAGFARSLIATGLIDEYQFLVHPIALGAGLPIFSELSKPLDLKLTGMERFQSGAIAKIYETASAA
jgi:dihydrofolate reductase